MSVKQFDNRIDMLNDAIAYFWGKPERKCIVDNLCSYVASDTSEGCVIGRLLDKDLARKLPHESVGGVSGTYKLLPEWMKLLGMDFLYSMQTLHDSSYFADMHKDGVIYYMKDYVDVSLIVYPESVEND